MLGASGQRTYEKHGYADALHAQISHGIFDYCGAPVITAELLLMEEQGTPDAYLDAAYHIGRRVFG